MNLREKITIIVMFFSLYAVGQFKYLDITKKVIPIKKIDTTQTFIYEVLDFKLIFAQSDILSYISKLQEREKKEFQILLDTLSCNSKQICVKKDTVYDKLYKKDKRDILSNKFTYIAADLLLEGKVLILSTTKRRLKTSKIICKMVGGYYGTEYLVFRLPNRKKIYEVVACYGE
jgi:hypothetical protein